jgi:hypothetical protein
MVVGFPAYLHNVPAERLQVTFTTEPESPASPLQQVVRPFNT